jgi:hypothetical protein
MGGGPSERSGAVCGGLSGCSLVPGSVEAANSSIVSSRETTTAVSAACVMAAPSDGPVHLCAADLIRLFIASAIRFGFATAVVASSHPLGMNMSTEAHYRPFLLNMMLNR